VIKQSYFTVTWGRHIYIKTIENILLNVFKHQKSFSLFRNIPHIPMCGGSERFVRECMCWCNSPGQDSLHEHDWIPVEIPFSRSIRERGLYSIRNQDVSFCSLSVVVRYCFAVLFKFCSSFILSILLMSLCLIQELLHLDPALFYHCCNHTLRPEFDAVELNLVSIFSLQDSFNHLNDANRFT